MTDPFHDPAFKEQVYSEFSRIGMQGGQIGGHFTPAQLLEALRLTPDGAGGEAFLAKLTELCGGSSDQ